MNSHGSTREKGPGHVNGNGIGNKASDTLEGTDIPLTYDVPEEIVDNYVPIDVEDVRTIYTMVVEYTGGDAWIDAARFDTDDYNHSQIGSALVQLANDPDCPLDLECWTESTQTPKQYRVLPKAEVSP